MERGRIWRRGMALLLTIWCVALPVIGALRASRPTAAKTLAYVETHPLESRSVEERRRIVEEFARQLNRLSFAERQNVQFEVVVRQFREQMTEEERAVCWQLTLSAGLRQMIEGFNRMSREERHRHLTKALAELDSLRQAGRAPEFVLSEADRNWIIHEGLMRYLTDTDAATKLELQPLVEQIQNILQMAR